MYNIQFQKNTYKIADVGTYSGTNLDLFLLKLLTKYGVTVTTPTDCCGSDNLFIRKGLTVLASSKDAPLDLYNFERYILKLLVAYGVITEEDITEICCKNDKMLHVSSQVLFFTNRIDLKTSSTIKWFNRTLNKFGVTYTDPCC